MNIHQFQYVLAVAENKHFESAATKCFVTQSTLSTMITKFEEEIGIKIFDRKKKPVAITLEGKQILEHLKIILKDIDHFKELTKELKGEIKGDLNISVIPTIAPFLLPLFLQDFASKFQNLNIRVKEQTTHEIIRQILSRETDIGIVSTPLLEKDIIELPLYDEPFVFYDAGIPSTSSISIRKVKMKNLCLMEEGHCMRTQMLRLCELSKIQAHTKLNFEFKAGSIDSLLRFVKANKATTLLPYLSIIDFPIAEIKHLSNFSSPIPYRSVGLIVHRNFVKKKILSILQKEIQDKVSEIIPLKNIKGEKLSPL